LLLLIFSIGAAGQNTIGLEAEYLLDRQGALSFESMRAVPDSAWNRMHDQSIQFPFWDSDYWSSMRGGVMWLRLEIPQSTTLNRLWLELLPNTGLNGKAIQFIDNQWQRLDAVGQNSGSEFYQPARYLTFILDTAVEEKTVYLRLTSDQVFGFSIRATPVEGLLWQTSKSQFLLGVVIGMVILAICYNLAIGLRARERLYITYSFFVFCNLLYLLYMAGLFRLLYPGMGSGAYVANFTSTLAVVASYLFVREFLDTRTQLPRIDTLFKILIGIFSGLVVLIPFVRDLYGYLISISVGIIAPILVLVVAVISLRKGHPLAKYFLVAWITYLISAGLWGWMWLGVVEPEEKLISFYYMGTLIEVALLSVVLGFRFSILKNQAESLGADKSRYKMLSRTDELTGVLNRRGFLKAVGRIFEHGYPGSLVWLALDVDNFKNFNDTFGHMAGDKLLQKFGEILNACSRNDDVVGRLGGEEFALLLVGCPVNKAEIFTSRLLEQFAQISVAGPDGQPASTTLSIGATEVRPGDDIESVWGRADDLLYQSKDQGRNRAIFD
jgi:diguanylate cyclase (GGDEF)-like protein